MIHCKKHIIAAGFLVLLPLFAWSEAPVVDESENFAFIEEQGQDAPVASKYDRQFEKVRNDSQIDNETPLVKEDQANNLNNNLSDNAKLIDKVQSVQQEIQELRGQLEVQAHDLKLLQQQQVAFYKDLDARLSGSKNAAPSVASSAKPTAAPSSGSKISLPQAQAPSAPPVPLVIPGSAASRANPADEQISYLAAYELLKNKRYDEALEAMTVFVQKYPRGGYTSNAEYWLGELYLVKKENVKAIEHFNVVLQQFPTSSKSAASMLKMGYAYAAQGNKPEAKKFLQQVVRAYPGTNMAVLANSKLATL